jgi:hypothetical protein
MSPWWAFFVGSLKILHLLSWGYCFVFGLQIVFVVCALFLRMLDNYYGKQDNL